MARKRFITSEISTDEQIATVAEENPTAALMWPWFIKEMDDWGRMKANPRELRLSVFQAFPFTAQEIQTALDSYMVHGLAHVYEVDGKQYLQANPDAWYRLQTYIQKTRQEIDGSSFPAPPNHPWGRYWSRNKESTTVDERRESPWLVYREEVFDRDDFTCVYCGSQENLWMDHILPRNRGGLDDPSNLATSCEPCNRKKRDRTPIEAGMPIQFISAKFAKTVQSVSAIAEIVQRPATSVPSPSHSHSPTDKNTPLTPQKGEYPSDFEDFWVVYPRKVNKKGAYAKWQATRRKKDPPSSEMLTECARRYALMCERKGTAQDYMLHPATFLGPQERWREFLEDAPVTETPPTVGGISSGEDVLALIRQRKGGAH